MPNGDKRTGCAMWSWSVVIAGVGCLFSLSSEAGRQAGYGHGYVWIRIYIDVGALVCLFDL